jgi:HSP20 family protein
MEVQMTKHFLPDLFGRQSAGTDIFSSLQREIDQVFKDFGRNLPSFGEGRDGPMQVKFNVAETDKAVEVTAEIPGVDVKDIDVQLREDVLTIKGEKKAEKDEKQKDYHLVERSYGMFERSFTLPAGVEAGKVEASFDKGVLTIVLPKAPEAQSKVQKIDVKPAA